MDVKTELMKKESYSIDDLREIMIILRSENGCPWDREQTHKSLRQDMLEEAYETVEAIDLENKDMLCEELGDVLLQVAFHSRLAEEAGDFNFDDVCSGVCKKMIERHPHVFGDVKADNVEEVLTNWDAIKQKSKKRDSLKEQLDGVCKALPALSLASKYVGKAIKSGLDVESLEIDGEINEDAIGDTLFKIVSLAKKSGIDPELALLKKCKEFLDGVSNKSAD